jgi:hypothetical protein
MQKLPEWLIVEYARVLVGEIYPEIRALAVKYFPEEKKILTICYLDREANEDDYEMLYVAASEMFSSHGPEYIVDAEVECVYSGEPFDKLDSLDGFIYARRE